MAAKSKKPEKVKKPSKELLEKVKKFDEHIGPTPEHTDLMVTPESLEEPRFSHGDSEPLEHSESRAAQEAGIFQPPPQALSLPLLKDSATLFIQGVQQLTAQLLGTPECAPLLVSVNGWLKGLEFVKKLIVGDDDKVEGLKKLVMETGAPWGERGSKQLTLAGATVKVKAVNHRDPDAPLTINDLDASKVEAYLRGNVDPNSNIPVEKTLAGYMKATTMWSLKDLNPLQQKNLGIMLADPGEWGQGLRQCLKETKYQMMAPTMGDES